jgi:hypothetical protein
MHRVDGLWPMVPPGGMGSERQAGPKIGNVVP